MIFLLHVWGTNLDLLGSPSVEWLLLPLELPYAFLSSVDLVQALRVSSQSSHGVAPQFPEAGGPRGPHAAVRRSTVWAIPECRRAVELPRQQRRRSGIQRSLRLRAGEGRRP